MQPIGYVVLLHAVRLDRPVRAYEKWIDRIPREYRECVLGQPPGDAPPVAEDAHCLALFRHYRSLMPMAQEARKPIFHLKPADGALGAHPCAGQDADGVAFRGPTAYALRMPPVTDGRRFALDERTAIVICAGEIAKHAADAIVEACDESMLAGATRLHRAAGPELADACRALPEVRPGVRCPLGEARVTPGFRLKAPLVIHVAIDPLPSALRRDTVVAAAYRSAFRAAHERRCRTVVFPPLGCVPGSAGEYPHAAAARTAFAACRVHGAGLEEIRFVLYGPEILQEWVRIADRTFV